MRSWKEISRESIVQVSNNTFNLQNLSGTFKSHRKSVIKYDHWVKTEGNQENHHVLNDLPLKRALWGVKKGSNANNSYWNIVFPTWSLLTLRWRWWFRRSRCLASKLCYDRISDFLKMDRSQSNFEAKLHLTIMQELWMHKCSYTSLRCSKMV